MKIFFEAIFVGRFFNSVDFGRTKIILLTRRQGTESEKLDFHQFSRKRH